ncbi:response regulator [Acidithiobacillus sp.]
MQIGVDSKLAVENRRIFVLDSDEISRMAVQFMLHDEYETHEFSALAAAVIKARDWPPDLLVIGMSYLQEQGVHLLEQMETEFPAAQLLLLLGEDDSPVALAGKAMGLAQLRKPLRLETVRGTVAMILRHGQ